MALELLGASGFEVITKQLGWRSDLAATNVTVRDSRSRLFKVQFHTAASLVADEQTDPLYVEWCGMDHRSIANSGHYFVRIDEDEVIAEVRDANETEWERYDAYCGEVTQSGQAEPCSEAEALAVVPA